MSHRAVSAVEGQSGARRTMHANAAGIALQWIGPDMAGRHRHGTSSTHPLPRALAASGPSTIQPSRAGNYATCTGMPGWWAVTGHHPCWQQPLPSPRGMALSHLLLYRGGMHGRPGWTTGNDANGSAQKRGGGRGEGPYTTRQEVGGQEEYNGAHDTWYNRAK